MTVPYLPSWQIPDQPGELCNFRGSNTGADAINMKVRYLNPAGPGDLSSGIRVLVQRTVVKGTAETLETAWDSGWVGNVASAPFSANVQSLPGNALIWNGRLYVATFNAITSNHAQIYSAPLTSLAPGSWRAEGGPSFTNAIGLTESGAGFNSITIVQAINGAAYLYADVTMAGTNPLIGSGIYRTAINGDGSLAANWTASNLGGSGAYGGKLISGFGSTYAWVTQLGTGAADAFVLSLNADGSEKASLTVTTNVPAATVGYSAIYDQTNGKVVVAGGAATVGSAPITTVRFAAVTASTGAIGAYSTSGAPLPAARANAAIGIANGRIYVIGGASAANDATPTNTVYSATPAVVETTGAGAWTTDTHTVPATLTDLAMATLTGGNNVVLVGGNQATVYTNQAGAGGLSNAFANGAASALTSGQLGTGGSVATNPAGAPQGSQDIAFAYGAFGAAATITSFNDGDQIQVSVFLADQTAGDSSTPGVTLINIGQPPTIASVSPANASAPTTGQPTLSFTYNTGAGGSPQATWRIKATHGAGVVDFDTGTRYDSPNSVQLQSAPLLPNAQAETMVITVASGDTPMTGSSASATSSTTFTPSLSAPAALGGLSANPNNAAGKVTVGWTNPVYTSPVPSIRIYYRLNGASAWTLLVDNIAPSGSGAAQTLDVFDEVPLATALDFGVSQILSNVEGAITAAGTNKTIDPVAGSYASFLHVAGNGANFGVALLGPQGSPNLSRQLDAVPSPVFASSAPLMRYGPLDYRTLQLKIFIQNTTVLKSLQAVLAQAQAGATLYYRDGFGTLLTVGLDPTQDVAYLPPLYREYTLRLVQIPDTYAPSTAAGSAGGYLAQANGSVVPLTTVEAAA